MRCIRVRWFIDFRAGLPVVALLALQIACESGADAPAGVGDVESGLEQGIAGLSDCRAALQAYRAGDRAPGLTGLKDGLDRLSAGIGRVRSGAARMEQGGAPEGCVSRTAPILPLMQIVVAQMQMALGMMERSGSVDDAAGMAMMDLALHLMDRYLSDLGDGLYSSCI